MSSVIAKHRNINREVAQPLLRFNEYQEDWNEFRFGDVFTYVPTNSLSRESLTYDSGTVKNIHYGDIHTKYRSRFQVNTEDVPYIKSEVNLDNIKEETYCKIGDVVIADASEDYQDVGKAIEIIDTDNQKTLSGLHTILARPNSNKFASGFLAYLLRAHTIRLQIMILAQGTKVLGISAKQLNEIFFKVPTIPEQQKIATFLSSTDEWIENLRLQKTSLEKYKKGMMQKLFSQQIRFKDENGIDFPDWEEKKLSEFLIQHQEKTVQNKQYPVLTSSQKGMFLQKDYFAGQDVASSDTTGYNVVPRGYFTYRHMSDTLVFKFNINTLVNRGIVSTLYPVFTTKNINDKYLLIKLNEGTEFKKYALLQKQGGSRTYMYYSKLKELKLNIPNIKEQEIIANFITSIEDLIILKEHQIAKAKELKKGLMQKMFI